MMLTHVPSQQSGAAPEQLQSCGQLEQSSWPAQLPSPQLVSQSCGQLTASSANPQQPSPQTTGQSFGQLQLVSPAVQQPLPQLVGQAGSKQSFSDGLMQHPSPMDPVVGPQSPGQLQKVSMAMLQIPSVHCAFIRQSAGHDMAPSPAATSQQALPQIAIGQSMAPEEHDVSPAPQQPSPCTGAQSCGHVQLFSMGSQ